LESSSKCSCTHLYTALFRRFPPCLASTGGFFNSLPVRAADSVGANIAEGTGRGSLQDSRRFARIARGSLSEVQHWLRRAYKRRLLTEEQTQHLKPVLDELAPKLNAYLRSMDERLYKSK